MPRSSHLLGTSPISIRIDGREVRLTIEEAKALRAGLERAIERVERFEHGVEGLIARSEDGREGSQ